MGIAEQFPGKQHQIGLAGADDVVGLSRSGNHPHGTGFAPGFPPDLLGKPCLVAGSNRYFGVRRGSAGGAIDQIHTQGEEQAHQFERLLNRPPRRRRYSQSSK